MDMRSSTQHRRRGSREGKVSANRSRHSTSSPEIMIASPALSTRSSGDETYRRRSTSKSPAPSYNINRRNSVGITDSISSSNCSNNANINEHSSSTSTNCSAGATPLTKNVGVGVNLGKPIVKSHSLSSAGAQHILPHGQQHQQHTTGTSGMTTTSGVTVTTNNINSHNNNNSNNNGNSVAINLGHGHIGTIAGSPSPSSSLSIAAPGGPISSNNVGIGAGVNHNSPLSSSPAANAPTTCTNKGVPTSNNQLQQQQHLRLLQSAQLAPSNQSSRMSPNSFNDGLPELEPPPATNVHTGNGIEASVAAASTGACKVGNSSSLFTSTMSGNDGNSINKSCGEAGEGIQTGPSSPSPSTESASSRIRGSNGESQPNSSSTGTPSDDANGSGSSSNGAPTTNRIVSQNVNGTFVVTGVPSNDSELQLFRVLQRANLLNYFDMMIDLGGDDVQQLCDAGEAEFLEIMALVGMASKPLHVRRLQKALQEWMTQPSLFQTPVLPPGYHQQAALPQLTTGVTASSTSHTNPVLHVPLCSPIVSTTPLPLVYPAGTTPAMIPTPSEVKGLANPSKHTTNQTKYNGMQFANTNNNESTGSPNTPTPLFTAQALMLQQAAAAEGGIASPQQLAALLSNLSPNNLQHHNQYHQQNNRIHQQQHPTHSNGHHHPSNMKSSEKGKSNSSQLPTLDLKIPTDQIIPGHFLETRIRTRSEASSPSGSTSSFAGSPHPDSRNSISPAPHSLQEHEIQKLAETAIHLIRSLPSTVAEPKFSSKRKTSGDYELILRLSETDPRRMDEVRRVAAVYGRADAKRKTYKPLSMHELAINEAAAQLCKHVPALLTKREELLSLSRQLVRESGLPYAAISSTFSISILTNGTNTANNNTINSSTSIPNNNNNNNNNDINTKSKYDEIHNGPTPSSSDGTASNSFFNGGYPKRLRLDGSSVGIEIQEYSNGRPPPIPVASPSPPITSNGMQITELRSFPKRRSPSDDDRLPSPLELVTVTTSDLRKSEGVNTGGGNKPNFSSKATFPSNSLAISRRSYSTESPYDLTTTTIIPTTSCSYGSLIDTIASNNFYQSCSDQLEEGKRTNYENTSSTKLSSIPVNGGSISITNQNGSHGPMCHRLHQYNTNFHNGMKILPVKSESTIN